MLSSVFSSNPTSGASGYIALLLVFIILFGLFALWARMAIREFRRRRLKSIFPAGEVRRLAGRLGLSAVVTGRDVIMRGRRGRREVLVLWDVSLFPKLRNKRFPQSVGEGSIEVRILPVNIDAVGLLVSDDENVSTLQTQIKSFWSSPPRPAGVEALYSDGNHLVLRRRITKDPAEESQSGEGEAQISAAVLLSDRVPSTQSPVYNSTGFLSEMLNKDIDWLVETTEEIEYVQAHAARRK